MDLKIYDMKTFSKEVTNIVRRNPELLYMEVVIKHAQDVGIEVEALPNLLSPRIKRKLHTEANDLNMFRDKTNTIDFEE